MSTKYPCPCGRGYWDPANKTSKGKWVFVPIMVPCRCGANYCGACAHTKCHVDPSPPPLSGNGIDWRGTAGGMH